MSLRRKLLERDRRCGMSPMHGESKSNYAARQAGQAQKREINERWQREHVPDSKEFPAACICPFRPWPHVVEWLPEWERSRHSDPRHFYVDERGAHRYSPECVWQYATSSPAQNGSPEKAQEREGLLLPDAREQAAPGFSKEAA